MSWYYSLSTFPQSAAASRISLPLISPLLDASYKQWANRNTAVWWRKCPFYAIYKYLEVDKKKNESIHPFKLEENPVYYSAQCNKSNVIHIPWWDYFSTKTTNAVSRGTRSKCPSCNLQTDFWRGEKKEPDATMVKVKERITSSNNKKNKVGEETPTADFFSATLNYISERQNAKHVWNVLSILVELLNTPSH